MEGHFMRANKTYSPKIVRNEFEDHTDGYGFFKTDPEAYEYFHVEEL